MMTLLCPLMSFCCAAMPVKVELIFCFILGPQMTWLGSPPLVQQSEITSLNMSSVMVRVVPSVAMSIKPVPELNPPSDPPEPRDVLDTRYDSMPAHWPAVEAFPITDA